MTDHRESSVRAAARADFRALAEAEGLYGSEASTALPLTERIRYLFENTIIPVREIARIAGVAERTIYKYAQKGDWKRRYKRNPRGAGGRFVPVEDEGKPHATGLKALDPEGARQASARCEHARLLSDRATAAARARAARAKAEREAKARLRRVGGLYKSLVKMVRMLSEDRLAANPRAVRVCGRLANGIVTAIERELAGDDVAPAPLADAEKASPGY